MNQDLLGILVMFGLALGLALPLGRFLANVFRGDKNALYFLAPIERGIFRLAGIDANHEMTWQQYLVALLTIKLVWFVLAMAVLSTQGVLPLNPDHNPSMSPDLAFNTAISFLVNCNLQHYSGESDPSYLSQVVVITFLQFVSAATGIAVVVVINALQARTTDKLGNFYNYFVKSLTRLLLPLSLVIALFLAFNGTPMTLAGKQELVKLQGDSVAVSRGPVAAMVAIKELGTNGGGFYGANSAHPLENPSYLTNMVENVSLVLIPLAMIFALGFYLKHKRLAWMIAIIIPALVPLALRGVAYKPIGASALLRRNLLVYGLGGVIVSFIGIKLIDLQVGVFM